MQFPFFVSKRLSYQSKRPFSRIIVRLAISSIVLSLLVILSSVAIVQGFKTEIQDKIIGFGSHIQVLKPQIRDSFSSHPMDADSTLEDTIRKVEGVEHIQAFANKPAIVRTEEEIEGGVFKGVGEDFNWDNFDRYLVEGEKLEWGEEPSDGIILSRYLSDRLALDVGDDVIIYFIDEPPRARRPEIKGIFHTGIREIDKRFIIGDLRHVQAVNAWEHFEIGGYELAISDVNKLDEINHAVRSVIPYDLTTLTIAQVYPQIFDWLGLIDMNVIIILVLMITVAAINMITALLIMILERTQMIGLFKALGATNATIRRIFILNASWIMLKGLLIGNLLAGIFIFVQSQYQLIGLNPESYYIDHVPVEISFYEVFFLNAGTLVLCSLALYLPSLVITRIQPAKSLRFE